MDENQLLFNNLKRTADVIVETFGRNCEVAVHNFDNLRKSLIYIAGTLTKRKPGAPITDLVLKELRKHGDDVQNMCNYRTSSKGGRIVKSSTNFIRDAKGKVIGALCINFDVTDFLNSISMVEDLIKVEEKKSPYKTETFASSPQETISSLLEEGIAQIGKQPPTMATEERLELITILESKGAFLIKGSVDFVAASMGISKYTVYNYLKKVRLNHSLNVT
ncbi:MAG: transcriptional regulator [Desulfobacteraceae bacterium]|nr:transcriptional regulator [Desulfobacteraceae bacterium]